MILFLNCYTCFCSLKQILQWRFYKVEEDSVVYESNLLIKCKITKFLPQLRQNGLLLFSSDCYLISSKWTECFRLWRGQKRGRVHQNLQSWSSTMFLSKERRLRSVKSSDSLESVTTSQVRKIDRNCSFKYEQTNSAPP